MSESKGRIRGAARKLLALGWALGLSPAAAGSLPAPSPSPQATASLSPTPVATEAADKLKRLSLEALMDLDVTSVAKAPQPWGEAPAAIDVITHDAMDRSGARTIPEALRLADNLEVAQKDAHDWAISSRGFDTDSANKLLVLMDGRSVYTPLFSGVFWDVQDYLLEDLDRIEVVSGPGGTLWGANAVNGVINITSKDAKETQGVYWQASGGSRHQDSLAVRVGDQLAPGLYYRVYGKYFDEGDEDFPDGSQAPDAWAHAQGGFRMDEGADPSEHFTL
ncbi:MAG TPA: TonB-dependent receptor plug domain-containing protein, partial [bacterium]|nr:TonB-dependent receptor plug domain-containing protein [bacterium]